VGLEELDGSDLARLGREWLLHGHLQDRVGVPLFLSSAGREAMEQLAIEEWMTASPIYSRRMQETLGFGPAGGGGDGVPDIFKNLQLDIGAPHQFLDFRFRVHDDHHGEFWLAHCGALMDVEPMGTDFVVGMCHHIEDPTFDATAGATNPYAAVRPIHRPPRVPSGRHPHCHWTVTIGDPATDRPAEIHPGLDDMAGSPLASLPVVSAAGEGRPDYSGPFDPDFALESLDPATLALTLDEFAFQSHLLLRAYMQALSRRIGADDAIRLGHRVLIGLAGLTAERLVRAGLAPDLPTLFARHPLMHPLRLTGMHIEGSGPLRMAVRGGHASAHHDPLSVLNLLDRHGPAPLMSVAAALDRRADVRPDRAQAGEAMAWTIEIDERREPAPEPQELALARFSTGATFTFRS
jgi:hypothetical protein